MYDAIFDPGAFVRHADEIVERLGALERVAPALAE
jgi:hypothetical protein